MISTGYTQEENKIIHDIRALTSDPFHELTPPLESRLGRSAMIVGSRAGRIGERCHFTSREHFEEKCCNTVDIKRRKHFVFCYKYC